MTKTKAIEQARSEVLMYRVDGGGQWGLSEYSHTYGAWTHVGSSDFYQVREWKRRAIVRRALVLLGWDQFEAEIEGERLNDSGTGGSVEQQVTRALRQGAAVGRA
jgi:hypothetical protein